MSLADRARSDVSRAAEFVSARTAGWAVVAIALAGLALRVSGVAYGLPDVHNPDEIPILNRALALRNDINPHNFLYPTLYFYALFAWEGLYYVLGRLIGIYPSLTAFQREFFVDPSRIVVAARALTALAGAATVPAVYWLGARLYDRATGLGAALFLAVAPLAVRDAHYIKLDVPVTLFVTLAAASLAGIVRSPERAARARSWFVAGLLAGLAMSTQYYVIFAAVPIALVAAADVRRSGRWSHSWRALGLGALGSTAGFIAGSPFFFPDLASVARDFQELHKVDIARAVDAGAFSSFGIYLRLLAADALGWPVCLLAAAGLVLSLVRDWRRGLVLAGFALPFLAFLANTFPAARYLNALLPAVAVWAALAAAVLLRRVVRAPALVFAAALMLAALPGLSLSLRWDAFFRQDDTRTLMRRFIEQTVPAGASVLVQPHSVQLRPSRESLVEALRQQLGSESRASVKFQNVLALDPYPAPANRVLYLGDVDKAHDVDKIYVDPAAFGGGAGLSRLRELGVAYVALTRYRPPNPAFAALEAALTRDARIVATFSPYRADAGEAAVGAAEPFFHNTAARLDARLDRPGPEIVLWKID